MDPIAGTGPIRQAASLLFYGWGYNFYRVENQLRADDLLIRNKVCGILAAARAHLAALEAEYRRVNLPPPTREAPLPDRQKTEQARRLVRSGAAIEQVSTLIQSAPVPTSDFVWLRHRGERGLLEILESIDVRLVDDAVGFHDRVVELDLAAISDSAIETTIDGRLDRLRVIVRERAERLTLMA
ncbi:hypothetical protein GCM10011611_05790 [Aliidongia dinghuensis]|uniref:Uncharacterized protein n=1 Tax=Aliidongia dinghuensis TaxID=1867774 RepID=A0A8J2YQ27_9PROT|nr:hypothetical protein [Aliidongia dinghuensis]GGF03095.1 hypothetical protein GCM10011611_05790 [Aliidongia dinghuensis]